MTCDAANVMKYLREVLPNPYARALGLALVLTVVSAVLAWQVSRLHMSMPFQYLFLHTALELCAIAVGILVFGVGWNAKVQRHSAHMVVLGAGFLATSLLDIGHALSFSGMPDFVTPSGTEKAIWFWLFGRVGVVATFGAAFVVPAVWVANRRLKACAMAIAMAYVASAAYIVLWHQDNLPRVFIDGAGLTQFKVNVEYILAASFAGMSGLIWWRSRERIFFAGPRLFAAAWMMAACEVALSLYFVDTDYFNLLGHLYKVLGTYLIYRAIFVGAVAEPFMSLQESEQKYRTLLDLAADGIIRVGPDGCIVDANVRASELAGIARGKLLGMQAAEIVACWLPDTEEDLYKQGTPFMWKSEMRQGDALVRFVEINARKMASGELQAILRDVTERKRYEVMLRKSLDNAQAASHAKSQFLANMSHELRTPLNAIIGFSELIHRQVLGPIGETKYLSYIKDVFDSGQHLLRIVDSILDVARIEGGAVAIRESEFEVGDLLDRCARMAQPELGKATPALRVSVASIYVRADEESIGQAVLSLLSNALKFTPAEGSIEVSVDLTPVGDAVIEVSDTGIGISSNDLPLVTGKFVQAGNTYTRSYQGVGLGLTIAKAYIEQHGGYLSIDSVPGKGTTAKIFIPRSRVLSSPAGQEQRAGNSVVYAVG